MSPQAGGSPQAYGGGSPQAYYGSTTVPSTASLGGMVPAPVAGDEAPPAPEVPHGPTSSLLFSSPSPSGN